MNDTLARHQSIWIAVESSDATPNLRTESPAELAVPLTDLTDEPDPEARAGEIAAAEAGRPFDLNQAPLFRCRLLRIGDEDHLLLLTFHHFAFDAWSQAVLLRELTATYQALADGEPPATCKPQIQYTDFAAWDRSEQRVDALADGRSFWRRELGDPPALQLPTDYPRPANTIRSGGAA